jgi:hypothetical protein
MTARVIQYSPPKVPILAGWACKFSDIERNAAKPHFITACQRVISREPYEPTGDKAFDIRAKTLRDLFLKGEKKLFIESNLSFQVAGLQVSHG